MKLALFLYGATFCLTVFIWQFLSRKDNLVNDCSTSRFAYQRAPFSPWSVQGLTPYPEICREQPQPIKRKQHGYFLHITDMHVDEEYVEGATVKSACHDLPSIYNINKKKKNRPDVLAGRYGTPGERCDAPIRLAQETLDWISKEWLDKLDFVIWTGDNSKHDWDKKRKRKRRHVYELNQRVTDMVMETFWPASIPVIPSFGNNDVFPHNQIGGPDVDGELLSFYEQMWRPWIPKNQRNTFKQGGYYMTQVAPRLNVLTLNTMYFYTKNHAVQNCLHTNSPAFIQLRWFEEQLKAARATEDRIYVIGHVPPSPRDYKGTCLTEYMRIASNYTDVIMGHFFAHLNMDHFLMFDGRESKANSTTATHANYDITHQKVMTAIEDYDSDEDVHATRNIKAYLGWLRDMYQDIDPLDDKRAPPNSQPPLVVVQVSPSILPVYNPAIRIYQYEINPDDNIDDDDDDEDDDDDDDDDEDELKPHGTLLNYAQYFTNLTKWNHMPPDRKLEYELEYSTDTTYGMEDLTVESYFELAKSMVDLSPEGQKLWATYSTHMIVKTKQFN